MISIVDYRPCRISSNSIFEMRVNFFTIVVGWTTGSLFVGPDG